VPRREALGAEKGISASEEKSFCRAKITHNIFHYKIL